MIRLFTLVMLLSLSLSPFLHAQEKSSSVVAVTGEEKVEPEIKIFPVPVLNGQFTITSDKAFTLVRMTNIIGQEIHRERFSYPRTRAEFSFTSAEKGIYLVTIEMEDKTRVVRKILVGTGN